MDGIRQAGKEKGKAEKEVKKKLQRFLKSKKYM